MAKYYATGTKTIQVKENGKKVTRTENVIIDNLPESRVSAVSAVQDYAKKNKIRDVEVHVVKETLKQPDPMSKRIQRLRTANKLPKF